MYTLDVTGCVRISDTLTAPLQDRGGQVINVQSYGIVPSSADNVAAYNALLTAIPTNGGLLYFPPGLYTFATNPNALTTPNVKIAGAGRGATVIKRTAHPTSGNLCGLFTVQAPGFELSDLTIQGAGSFTATGSIYGKGVYIHNAARGHIHDIEACNLEGEAIYADGESSFTRLERNYVHDNAMAGINLNCSMSTSAFCRVVDNTTINNAAGGLQIVCKSSLVERNMVSNPLLAGCDLVIIDGTSFVFADNMVVDSAINSAYVNALCIGQFSAGQYEQGIVRGNIIRNNKTANSTTGGPICIDNIANGDILIDGNFISENGQAAVHNSPAISIRGGNMSAAVLVTNNYIRRGANNWQGKGIRIEATVPISNHIVIREGHIDSDVTDPYAFAVQPQKICVTQ